MEKLTQGYWENRYLMQDTGWDIGQISAPFKAYFDQLRDKNIKITPKTHKILKEVSDG